MNRSHFALFVALLIHLIFLLVFWLLGTMEFKNSVQEKDEEKKIKISLKELPPKLKKETESGQIKKQTPKTDIAPPMPKGSQLKHLTPEIRKTTLNKTKETTKPKDVIKKIQELPKKPYISLFDKNTSKEEKENPLYSLLSQDLSSKEKKQDTKKNKLGSNITNNIKELYGDKFGELSSAQQQYILNNQEVMRRITQQVLNRVARVNIPHDLRENRVNIIEFYLHPNGDMSDFKFLQKSGQYILDDTTRETIEYAYSRYPRPSEKTLIRYNVFYNLARY